MYKCSEKYTFLTSTIMYNCRLSDMIESYWKMFYSFLSRGYSVLHQWVNSVKVVRNHSKRLLIRFMEHKNKPLYPLNLLTQLLQSAWSRSSCYDCCKLLLLEHTVTCLAFPANLCSKLTIYFSEFNSFSWLSITCPSTLEAWSQQKLKDKMYGIKSQNL